MKNLQKNLNILDTSPPVLPHPPFPSKNFQTTPPPPPLRISINFETAEPPLPAFMKVGREQTRDSETGVFLWILHEAKVAYEAFSRVIMTDIVNSRLT